MNWIVDVDGNLVNLDHIESIIMEDRGKDFNARFQVMAFSDDKEFILGRFQKINQQEAFMKDLKSRLMGKDS